MGYVKDLYLELDHGMGDNYQLSGRNGGSYYVHTFISYVDQDQSRGFLELSKPMNDGLSSKYFIMEIGGSDISIAIREGGSLDKERLKALKENYLDGMREVGIDAKRLQDITPKSSDEAVKFEEAIGILLTKSPAATQASKKEALKTGLTAPPPGFDM